MSDIEERPSKMRKLSPTDTPNDSLEQPPKLFQDDKNSGASGREISKIEENYLSVINVQHAKEEPPISKSQLKKRRRQELWESQKDLRKDKRKDKRHEKAARKAEQRAELQEKIAKGEIEKPVAPPDLAKRKQPRVLMPMSLIIDCDFDELMTEKELVSLGSQLTRCYSDNRRSRYRSHMVMCSWKGALRTRFETVLTNHHLGWKGVRFMEADFVDAAGHMDGIMKGPGGGKLAGALAPVEESNPTAETEEVENQVPENRELENKEPESMELDSMELESMEPEGKESDDGKKCQEVDDVHLSTLQNQDGASKDGEQHQVRESLDQPLKNPAPTEPQAIEPSIVYLTSDSPHTLDRLSPNTSYIIGGIVDKNRHKGICYKRACERGIPTAKLPIAEYMTMQSRTVLTVNHVVEITLKWLETGDWGEAFLSVIPKRKEAKLRVKKGQEGAEEYNSDVEEYDDVNLETAGLSMANQADESGVKRKREELN